MFFPIFGLYFSMKMSEHSFNLYLIVMSAIAVVVFVSLYFVDAGYGKFYNKKWGPTVNNKLGWVLMESPVLLPCCCFGSSPIGAAIWYG